MVKLLVAVAVAVQVLGVVVPAAAVVHQAGEADLQAGGAQREVANKKGFSYKKDL